MRVRDAPNVFKENPPQDFTWGAHATSPYCIRRIIDQGALAVGMASLKIDNKDVKGVYFHKIERMEGGGGGPPRGWEGAGTRAAQSP